MSIYLGEGTTTVVSDMKGPCPDGFHIPLQTEWSGLSTIMSGLGLSSGNNWMINLHMPFAGYRNYGNLSSQGSYGFYWSSSTYNSDYEAYNFVMNSSTTNAAQHNNRTFGYSIRAFKNEFVVPTSSWTVIKGTLGSSGIFRDQTNGLISITSNGTTGYTIMDKNLGATTVFNNGGSYSEATCGCFFQRGNNNMFPWQSSMTTSTSQVNANNYGPGNYYSSDTFIIRTSSPYGWDSSNNTNLRGGTSQGSSTIVDTGIKSAYIGDTKAKAVYVGTTKYYPKPREQLWPNVDTLVSTENGTIKHGYDSNYGEIELKKANGDYIIIADRNVGANAVNEGGTTFQRGNNYGFPTTGNVSVTTTLVDASSYGPSTVNGYYSRNIFVDNTNGYPYDWQTSPANKDLRGGITGTQEAMRGPCPEGYHIPTYDELVYFNTILNAFAAYIYQYYSVYYDNVKSALFITYPGGRQVSGEMYNSGTNEVWWSCTHNGDRDIKVYNFYKQGNNSNQGSNSTRDGFRSASIRPFKNT